MIVLTRVKEATAEFIKVLRFGKYDVQTSSQIVPFGVDSKPTKNMLAVHSTTANKDKSIVLGYEYNSSKTSEGEARFYSTNSDGSEEKADIKLTNNGIVEINGNADFMVRYSKLETAYNELKTAHNETVISLNAVITTLKTWIVAPTDGGAALKLASAALQNGTTSSGDISASKIDNVKTN